MSKISIWTKCWKGEGNIYSQKDCNYLKSRDGNYSFCHSCYNDFLSKTTEFFRPELSRKEEIIRSRGTALNNFHDQMVESASPIRRGCDNLPTLLIHTGSFYDCEVCKEIKKVCSCEHCIEIWFK